jgi:hypothetical protein
MIGSSRSLNLRQRRERRELDWLFSKAAKAHFGKGDLIISQSGRFFCSVCLTRNLRTV